MKKIALWSMLVLVTLQPVISQNILVLEKPGVKKNFKYKEGDKIDLKTRDSITLKGMITSIKDTLITLNFYTEVRLHNVMQVTRTRWAISILSKVLLIGGAGMIIVEALNGAISNTPSNTNFYYYGAGAAAAGALTYPLEKARYPIGPDKWRLKVLVVEKEFNYQKNKPVKF
jgi:hypothetical protein